jgi:hypothetical protein
MPGPRVFERAYATGTVAEFQQRVADNLLQIAGEIGEREFAIPLALFLVISPEAGGDQTADEMIRRFGLLDVESRNVIDFFFLGWRAGTQGRPEFDLQAFASCRDALRRVGVTRFGGNADLIIVDAWLRETRVDLDFERAIHIDLASARGRLGTPGAFLQGLIAAAEDIRGSVGSMGPTVRISDRLGLASARRSLLDFILDKWGKAIGAPTLAELATRRLGPTVELSELSQP